MRDFFKYTFATLLGLFIFMGLSIGGLIALLIGAASQDTEPKVANQSVLVFDLGLDIIDAPPGSGGGQALEEALSGTALETISLRSAINAIDQAAKDQRIAALYLYGNINGAGNGSGFATLKEIREALQRFKASGKKIIAYQMDWQERDYYLGSVANTITLNPFGSLEVNGLSSEATFFANALQKFGVGVQVTRVGKYKSAVEPFLLTERSPANQQQTETLLGDLWREFLTSASTDRKLTPQQLQAISDREAELEPAAALKLRLVDKLAYQDEVLTELKQITGNGAEDKAFRQVTLKDYAKVAEDRLGKDGFSRNQIAIVYAEGNIVDGQGQPGQIGGDRFAKQLRELRLDKNVKAIVLRVNSPGGSASASEVIQREVILTRKVKPVIVSMGTVAASGGYWISTYSDRIFAEPNTITGSIGVFGVLPNIQKLGNNIGITWDTVKTSRYADIRSVSRPKTPQELALIQQSVDRIYNQFISKVAESRKLNKTKVADLAQGRVWSGIRAKDLGLVDQLGGLNDAIQYAVKKANLGDQWTLTEYPKPRSLTERLFGSDKDDKVAEISTKLDPLTTEAVKLYTELSALRALNDPRGIYVRLPYNFRID